jgi:enoyl-CoA hydratase
MTVDLTHDGFVAVVTLDRPSRRNAVDHATLLELLDIQAGIASRTPDAIRAVVLTGKPPAFSAGADLNGVEEGQFATDLSAVLRGFGRLPVPVIAAIDGPALGAGAQLAIATDLRVATPTSTLGIPAAKLGLVVDHWTIRRLASEFSPPIARAMLLAAQTYTAEQLHASGGVHRLGTLDEAVSWAHELARLAPLTIAGHKLGLERAVAEPDLDDDFEAARSAAWASRDAEEGRTAFLDKRRPEFTGH